MGRLAADDLVEHRAQEIDIAEEVDALDGPARHFGSHVGGRAAEAIGLENGVRICECRRDAGEAPVHHEDFAVVAEHDVFGLEIAMDHAVGVCEGDGVGHTEQDAQVLLAKARSDAQEEARKMIAGVQTDDASGQMATEFASKNTEIEAKAKANFDKAVAFVLERVIGRA